MVNQTVKFYIVSVKAIMFEVNKTMIALILLLLLVIAVLYQFHMCEYSINYSEG